MTAAKQPLKTATTATGTAFRGTSKRIREAGVDFTQPVLFRGEHFTTPGAEATRYERVEVSAAGVYATTATGARVCLGGVATRFWLEQAPVEVAPVAVTEVDDADPIVGGKALSAMTFAELMELAKAYRVKGRGTARIDALRAGVAAAITAEIASLVLAG